MKNPDLYLIHILDSSEKIAAYIEGKEFKDFKSDFKLQDAVVWNLETIGEATRHLSKQVLDKIDLPWKAIKAIRDKIAHDYLKLDLKILWETASIDVPKLRKALLPYNPEK